MTGWRAILAALIGVIAGSVITAGVFLYTGAKVLQERTARELLSEVVALVSLQEGWLLQGEGSQTAKLSDHPGLPEAQSGSGLWLLPVELRAILDEAQWNAPSSPSYGFIQGRRVWIIRNDALPDAPLSYSGVTQEHFPALTSSAGRQELCAWIERVQIAYNGGTLTDHGLAPLRPYLVPLAQEDRVKAFRILLSQDARNFLAQIEHDGAARCSRISAGGLGDACRRKMDHRSLALTERSPRSTAGDGPPKKMRSRPFCLWETIENL